MQFCNQTFNCYLIAYRGVCSFYKHYSYKLKTRFCGQIPQEKMNLIHPGVVDGKTSIAENYPGPDYESSMLMIQFAEPRHHVQEKLSQNKPDPF